ncbi:MAG TPA: hypothetical protein VE933_11515 [Chitinophagaceae bacterium]|nr:hypothetical protein [Chitinophagaceae bacterium]
MIATLNKATKAAILVARVSKAGKEAKQELAAVIQETRGSRAGQVGAISKDSKVNRETGLIVIARDSKAICPTGTASRVSKKKLLPIVVIHLMMMTRTQVNQNTRLQTGMRIQTAA